MTTTYTPLPPASAKRVHHEVRFGQYILGSTLGEGEFGKVKLGWRKDAKLPSQVAIKLIRRDTLVKDAELEIKIHREINSLKLLSHPNIVSLVEVMKSGKYIGIVLEYALGGELFDYILTNKYLKEPVAKRLFAQLISGVDYMHHKGLVHRDLKLENLLLDKHKNVIISDFGFVNAFGRDKADLMKTSCGLPCYAAPELVLSQSAYHGRRVDIWLLGVILYAMLLGYLPFDDDPENQNGEDIMRLYDYICRTPLTFPDYVLPLARDLLRRIIVPDPKRRIGMPQIRAHPWLFEHSALLSITAAEWDRAAHEKQQGTRPAAKPDRSKRYSMFDAHTGSQALRILPNSHTMSQFGLRTAIIPGPALSSSSASTDNVYSASSTFSDATKSAPVPRPVSASAHSNSTESSWSGNDHRHESYSTQASIALKTMYEEKPRGPKSVSPTPSARSSPYQGYLQITTIIESPVKAQSKPKTVPAPSRFPTSNRKPRPTSYHPLSISGSLLAQPGSPTFLEYIQVSGSAQMLSPSPPKALAVIEADVTPARSTSSSPVRHSRRNSLVTMVHASGVLSGSTSNSALLSDSSSKRSSVLLYLEDKMDPADLADVQSSPKRSASPRHRASIAPETDPNETITLNMLPPAMHAPESGNNVSQDATSAGLTMQVSPSPIKLDNSAITTEQPGETPIVPTLNDTGADAEISSQSATPSTPALEAELENTPNDAAVASVPKAEVIVDTVPEPVRSVAAPTQDKALEPSLVNDLEQATPSSEVVLVQQSMAALTVRHGPQEPELTTPTATGHSTSQPNDPTALTELAPATSSQGVSSSQVGTVIIPDGDSLETKPLTKSSSFESLSKRIISTSSKRNASKENQTSDENRSTAVSGNPGPESRKVPNEQFRGGQPEVKKRNRFSIVSFYGGASLASSYEPSLAPNRRPLEPSNAANLPSPMVKQDKRAAVPNSRHSMSAASNSHTDSTNGKEASAARKVIDFFRRKSVRM